MVATRAEPVAPSSDATRRWFRCDVDGLRAIAIVLVVGYHAGLPRFGGGFIGVDVFFVISGFLISRNLLRESEVTDRISLAGFWARRVRRLVPALALVVVTTLIVGSFVLPRFELGDLARQGGAASLYVSNMLFAVDAQDYFAADLASSPFLHTWSLGVEEQFYLVWPLLFAAVAWWQRRRLAAAAAGHRRLALVVAFGIAFACSMALNLVLTSQDSAWAFFGLPSRAWEFAVAGLLAAVPVPNVLRGVVPRTVLAVGGLAVLGFGARVIEDETPYPGLWAVLPVAGTSLLIVAGETWGGDARPTVVSRALAVAPMQWLGRVSYSWYLWHWPAIVLTTVWLGDGSTTVKSAAALASLAVAWVVYRYVETPLRFAPVIAGSNRRTFAFGIGITLVTLLVAGAVWLSSPRYSDADVLAERPAADATLEEKIALTRQVYETRNNRCDEANRRTNATKDAYCLGGDPAGTRSLMVLGDSHSGQWHRPFDEVAAANGIRLYYRQRDGCPAIPVLYLEIRKNDTRPYTYCQNFQAGDLRLVDDLDPDAVIVAQWSGNLDRVVDASGNALDATGRAALWEDGVRTLHDELTDRGVRIGWLLDAPTLTFNSLQCLDKQGSVDACEPSRTESTKTSASQLDIERRVLAEAGDVATVDLTELLCDAEVCRLEQDGTLTYVDHHHLSAAFTASQIPVIEDLVERTLGR